MKPTAPRLALTCLLGAALLSACSILPQSDPQDIYRLPDSAVAAANGATLDVALRILRPAADDVLRGSRIAVRPQGNVFSVYQGARWSAPAPTLWRDHLVEAFYNDGRIARVSSEGEGLRADFELGGTLRGFHTEYHDGKPRVVIRFDARLAEAAGRNIVASRRFTVTEDVAGGQVPAVVEAFGRASDIMARQIIDWTAEQLGQSRR